MKALSLKLVQVRLMRSVRASAKCSPFFASLRQGNLNELVPTQKEIPAIEVDKRNAFQIIRAFLE